MRDLLDFLFKDIGEERIFYTKNVDEELYSFKQNFVLTHNLKENELLSVQSSIIDNFRMLFFQKKNRRYYGFSTLKGDPTYLVTEEMVIDMKTFHNNGVALYLVSPEDLTKKGFTRESWDAFCDRFYNLKSQKKRQKVIDKISNMDTVIGYYVYVNEKGEADILDLSNKVCTLYVGTEKEKSMSFIRSIIKHTRKDQFLCATHTEGDTTDHFFYVDKDFNFLGSVNEKISLLLGHDDFKVHPGTYDLFAIREKGEKTSLYSYEKNLIYNEFELDFKILNVLNSDVNDYFKRTLVVMLNHDINREGNEDILAFSPLNVTKEEDKGRYVDLPTDTVRSMKQIYGTDILYCVNNNPTYETNEIPQPELDEWLEKQITSNYDFENKPYIITLMYMNENDEFTLDEIPASSVPVSIYVTKETGTITLTFKQDVFYNVVTFFKEYYTMYKYSYMEISTSGIKEKIQRKLTGKKLQQLRNHLLETGVSERTIDDEFNQMHRFVKVKIQNERDGGREGNNILASSYFVDLSIGEPNYDINRLFVNKTGKFLEFSFSDTSQKNFIRMENKNFNLEEYLKQRQNEEDWIRKHL